MLANKKFFIMLKFTLRFKDFNQVICGFGHWFYWENEKLKVT